MSVSSQFRITLSQKHQGTYSFALLSGPRACSVFVRFLRPSVRVKREHAQTHEHLRVLSEGTGWDGGRARTAAAPARALIKFIGSPAISPAWENAPAFAITPARAIALLPTVFDNTPRSHARSGARGRSYCIRSHSLIRSACAHITASERCIG